MFKSFFPKPGAFFLSAFVWALIAVIFWQAGGGDWVARITGASGQIPISAARFWSLDFLIFYAYYIVCVGLFAFFWFIYSPHRWQYWSILGTALIIFVTWFMVKTMPRVRRRLRYASCLAPCGKTISASIFTICISTSPAFSICRSITFSVCSCCFRQLLPVRLRSA